MRADIYLLVRPLQKKSSVRQGMDVRVLPVSSAAISCKGKTSKSNSRMEKKKLEEHGFYSSSGLERCS